MTSFSTASKISSSEQKPVLAAAAEKSFISNTETPLRSATCACGGDCPKCNNNRGIAQEKPQLVSFNNDTYEQTSDKIANALETRIHSTNAKNVNFHILRSPGQKNPAKSNTHETSIPDSVNRILNSAGRPLDLAAREFFEPRLGYDFSNVRIHTNDLAAKSAQDVNALAYTVGHNVVFNSGQYDPDSQSGKHLLAHELTHVKQVYEGRVSNTSRISQAGDTLEMEADNVASNIDVPNYDALTPLSVPSTVLGAEILRTAITMSSTHRVTDSFPAMTDNIREEVLALLDRLHTMWSITNTDYDNQYRYVNSLAPTSQVPQTDRAPSATAIAAGITAPWSFQPTIDAIARNQQPSLAAQVIRRYMGITVTDSVGSNLANMREDVLTVMNRLNFLSLYNTFSTEQNAVTAITPHSRAPDSMLSGMFSAISNLKERLAAGTIGINPMHSDELEYGGADRFAAQSAIVDGDTIPVVSSDSRGRPQTISFTKHFSVFIPSSAPQGLNKVHLFFTPFLEPEQFVAQQGLRAQHDGTDWILIAVPALIEGVHTPNFITVSTVEIGRCLAAAGRPTTINAIRMSAHSRGQRGLINTMGTGPGRRGPSLIDLALVEGVTVFDASYAQVGSALRQRQTELTGLQDPAHPSRFRGGAIRLYDVTVPNISGLAGIPLPEAPIRGLAYVRLVQEGIARDEVSQSDLSSLPTRTLQATNDLLGVIPARGRFSTLTPTPSGQTDLNSWLSSNRTNLMIAGSTRDGLKSFITAFNLDWGAGFSPSIDAHHWFVTELAHESLE
jgi:hypothetical protein